jgi:pleiotrophin
MLVKLIFLNLLACRYEKGTWSECTGAGTGQMQRTDKLKTTTDASCQATRTVNKNCNNGKSKDKKTKEERKTKNGNKDKGNVVKTKPEKTLSI